MKLYRTKDGKTQYVRYVRNAGGTYHPSWCDDPARAADLSRARAVNMLRWLHHSKTTAGQGYQYGATGDPPLQQRDVCYQTQGTPADLQRAILEALTRLGNSGATAIAEEVGISRSHCHRILLKLEIAGAVQSAAGRTGAWRVTTPYLALNGETYAATFGEDGQL